MKPLDRLAILLLLLAPYTASKVYSIYQQAHLKIETPVFSSSDSDSFKHREEVSLLTDSDLQKTFQEYNKQYFNNELRKDQDIKFEDCPPGIEGYFNYKDWTIRLDKTVQSRPRELQTDLIHEMAHEWVRIHYPGDVKIYAVHGEAWRAEMRKLAGIGALDTALWSEEEN